MPKTWTLVFHTEADFKKFIGDLNVEVGSRLKSRCQETKENYVLKYYFEMLIQVDKVAYPVSIVRSESPDFQIHQNNLTYGLEITESTFQAYQFFLTESAKRKLDFSPSVFRYQENDNIEAVQRILKENSEFTRGRVWKGIEAEKSAAGWAFESVKRKLAVISKWKCQPNRQRICLYQNCPGWIDNVEAFADCLKSHLNSLVESNELKPDEICVDYLVGSDRILIYDVIGERLIIRSEGATVLP